LSIARPPGRPDLRTFVETEGSLRPRLHNHADRENPPRDFCAVGIDHAEELRGLPRHLELVEVERFEVEGSAIVHRQRDLGPWLQLERAIEDVTCVACRGEHGRRIVGVLGVFVVVVGAESGATRCRIAVPLAESSEGSSALRADDPVSGVALHPMAGELHFSHTNEVQHLVAFGFPPILRQLALRDRRFPACAEIVGGAPPATVAPSPLVAPCPRLQANFFLNSTSLDLHPEELLLLFFRKGGLRPERAWPPARPLRQGPWQG